MIFPPIKRTLVVAVLLALFSVVSVPGQDLVPGPAKPPTLPREFRAAWVASVKNLDWPSRKGLSAGAQKAELRRILDRARQLGLNAIILQVRPAADALYRSPYEPWSEYLTGHMGRSPGYDPLEFAIGEAHARGLELHAWFNPFRARHYEKSSAAANHVTRERPDLVIGYSGYKWLDPAKKASRDLALNVMLDVTRRYDVDGIHMDDYFYPYQVKDKRGRKIDFADHASWAAYQKSGGRLDRRAWRRSHVDALVSQLYSGVKSAKPWVKVGISPFGIWRPGYPRGIEAELDAYSELAADARKWLHAGWLDYCSPQLYWPIDQRPQSYSALLRWWAEENKKRRHVWPGMATERIGRDRDAGEILRQIEVARQTRGVTGHVHWNMNALMKNKNGIATQVKQQPYAVPALVPGSPWLGGKRVPAPKLEARGNDVSWAAGLAEVRFWIVQAEVNGRWQVQVLPASTNAWKAPPEATAVGVAAFTRTGYQSAPATLVRR